MTNWAKSSHDSATPKIEYKKICPIGWYKTEIVYADADNKHESTEASTEFVMVYEHTKDKFKAFIKSIPSANLLDEWSKEYLDDELMQPKIKKWINEYFDRKTDDIGQKLESDLIKIVRHIAQDPYQSAPEYHSFEQRETYDLDKIAYKVIDFSSRLKYEYLDKEFSQPETLWKVFYKSLIRFETAVDAAIRNIINPKPEGETTPVVILPLERRDKELNEVEKEEVKKRDGYACLCCGVNTKGKLQIDHIKPFSMGGETSKENSQTLCVTCNKCKGQNEIDFRCNTTKLSIPKNLDLSLISEGEKAIKALTRVLNFFYHCKAVSKIDWEVYTYTYNIYLYPSNNPEWLLQHKAELLKLIKNKLGCHAEYINVNTMK
ncbi:HNH endonuclease [Nostoc sp.]|uniref:HNH endonuclease n=1 Tax=Nostoc sp. TaxID=1180 RepID=UPI002FF6144A